MFECTQRLECTQDLYTQSLRECPEQIGFLGICGNKYPVKKGPNKIGRDPQTCNIVLNLNSVSRQHAVINVLNNKEFMIMDLDSANKTKLLGKSLMPYMPQPLKNGDTVQFGEIFGIFRLLEEEDDLAMTQALPMTQVISIPDTPVPTRHVSKLASVMTIPESPDVSDKEDSFIIPSQPNAAQFKNSNSNFIKPGKTISIQPVGGNKIDNVYWNSSKKSTSLILNDSISSLNNSIPAANIKEKENEANASNIHEKDIQAFPLKLIETDLIYEANTQLPESPIPPSIYSANTQLPDPNVPSPSIYTANTQLPVSHNLSPGIYSVNTQLPVLPSPSIHNLSTQMPPDENFEVYNNNEQQDLHLNLVADKDIYDADTQMFPLISPDKISLPKKSTVKSNHDRSNDLMLVDDIETISDEEGLESQVICTKGFLEPITINSVKSELEPLSQIALPKSAKRNRIKSDSSSDCDDNDDDILLSQKKTNPEKENRVCNDEDLTDCEDNMIELTIDKKDTIKGIDLEDVATQVIEVVETLPNDNSSLEDMLTQVIPGDEILSADKVDGKIVDFEDLPTQVLVDDIVPPKTCQKELSISDEVEISPFKVPLKSAFKAKKKDLFRTPKIKPIANVECKPANDEQYYQDTQDLFEDLCSQRPFSPEAGPSGMKLLDDNRKDNEADTEENINKFVSALTSPEIRDVIGVEKKVVTLKKTSSLGSDSSDLESTPKKVRPFKFMDMDFPDSQEIKISVSNAISKSTVTESSSESENELNSEDQCTPILFRKKKKTKSEAKMDLSKRFDLEALPTRVITRVRKPTSKVQDSDNKKLSNSILKSKFLTEQDDDVDKDIITENITRLKSKNDKSKNFKDTSKVLEVIKYDTTKIQEDKRDINKETPAKTSPNTKKTFHAAYDNSSSGVIIERIDESQKPGSHNVVKDSKSLTTTGKESHKEIITRESRRKNKPLLDNQNSRASKDDVLPNDQNKNSEPNITFNIDLTKDKKENEPKVNTRNLTCKGEEEKSRGPIIIEPHTITIPFKEEKKKRVYKRKNKDSVLSNKVEEDKSLSSDSKPDHVETKRPVRSTRGKKKITEDFITELEPTKDEKLKRTKKDFKEPLPEKEQRRSSRQKTVKENEQSKESKIKSILKNTSIHEQSTVYNLSTGSNSDTPNLKRSAEFVIPEPMAKRTRAASRATPNRKNKPCYVLFTAFPNEEVKGKLETLGAVVVTDVMQCTVLLTLEIRRTFKLLCAVGLGKPIVGPSWVQACVNTKMIVDPWLYTIKDEAAEKRFNFNLQRTLSGDRGFLKGYNVSSTPSVMPQASEMKLIVQCSGGTWKEGGPHWLCLSKAEDRALWPALLARGAILVTTELILGGVLRQTLNIEANRIKVH